MSDATDDLVTLRTVDTPFEAHTIAAVLGEAGIEAQVFDGAHGALPLGRPLPGVPIQVRRFDVDRARTVLAANLQDSVDIDWDEVDVGEREDDLPPAEPGRMPPAARVAFVVTLIVLLAAVAAVVAMGWRPF